MSVANQKSVLIKKEKYQQNFLQIGIDEWKTAFKIMAPNTFGLYLYLSGNANEFRLELSFQAVNNELGMSRSSYDRAIRELKEKGYMNRIQGNMYSFSPKVKKGPPYVIHDWSKEESRMNKREVKNDASSIQKRGVSSSKVNIEINKKNKKKDIDLMALI